MSEPTFQIVFRGKILGGFDREQVRTNLATMFRTDVARIDAILDAPKTVMKTGLGKDAAGRYQDALRQAGIMVAIMGESEPASPPEPARPTTQTITREVVPVPQSGYGAKLSAPEDPIAVERTLTTTLTLAEPGVRLLPAQERPKAEIDTSALTLAQPGVVLIEKRPAAPPEFDLTGISLGDANEPIVPRPHALPLAIDTSALALTEQAPEVEKPLSELQKLLTTSVD